MNENLVAATECKTTLFLFPATIASGASPWLLHPSAKQPQALLDLCVDFCTHYFYLFAADKSHGRGQNSLPWLPQAQTLAVCRKPTIYPTCGRCCWLPTALSLSELRMRKEEAKPMHVPKKPRQVRQSLPPSSVWMESVLLHAHVHVPRKCCARAAQWLMHFLLLGCCAQPSSWSIWPLIGSRRWWFLWRQWL